LRARLVHAGMICRIHRRARAAPPHPWVPLAVALARRGPPARRAWSATVAGARPGMRRCC